MGLPNNLVYPKAKLRLLDARYRPAKKLVVLNRVNFHSTASQSTSQFSYFNAPDRASSHLHLDKAGNWEQYQYLDLRSEADLEGNDATWSIETQGVSGGVDEPWTSEQVRELTLFLVWAYQYGLEKRLATSSVIGAASRGVSSHRLGIDGNFPALPSVQAGRLQRGGGMHWSTSKGKVCPGYLRQAQIPGIFAVSVTPIGTHLPPLPPVTGTAYDNEDDMYQQIIALYQRFLGRTPSTDEIVFWTNQLSGKPALAGQNSFLSTAPEPGTVVVAYKDYLGREPSQDEIASWLKMAKTVQEVRAGVANSEEAKG